MSGRPCVVELRDHNLSIVGTRIGSNFGITAANNFIYKVPTSSTSRIGMYFLGTNPNQQALEQVEILYANITVTRIS